MDIKILTYGGTHKNNCIIINLNAIDRDFIALS